MQRQAKFLNSKENSVASEPTRVCMCTNSILSKHETKIRTRVNVFLEQTFEIEAVAVGQIKDLE